MEQQREKVSAVLIAAGGSQRMGAVKQLLPIGNITLIEKAVDNLLGSEIEDLVVVVGAQGKIVADKLANRIVTIATNNDYRTGMSSSIITGVRLIKHGCAVMIALADQPFIGYRTINVIISAFMRSDKGIVVPTYRGQRGHPVIFSMRYRDALLALRGDIGGRNIISGHPDDVLECIVDDIAILKDIDTPIDYAGIK
jgi:molybdenum cofactor cytidylyltransferase